MAQAPDGCEDVNRQVRQPFGFRIRRSARERIFQTTSVRVEFAAAPLR
ncbi:MAG: hypothetical protein ACR2LF_01900 [Jatrophihabitantaceae bacterium]